MIIIIFYIIICWLFAEDTEINRLNIYMVHYKPIRKVVGVMNLQAITFGNKTRVSSFPHAGSIK